MQQAHYSEACLLQACDMLEWVSNCFDGAMDLEPIEKPLLRNWRFNKEMSKEHLDCFVLSFLPIAIAITLL